MVVTSPYKMWLYRDEALKPGYCGASQELAKPAIFWSCGGLLPNLPKVFIKSTAICPPSPSLKSVSPTRQC